MGLEPIRPRPRTTMANPDREVYPHLPRDAATERRDQAWSSDITHPASPQGLVRLGVVMDRRSRFVLPWRLANALEGRSW